MTLVYFLWSQIKTLNSINHAVVWTNYYLLLFVGCLKTRHILFGSNNENNNKIIIISNNIFFLRYLRDYVALTLDGLH